MFLMDTNVVSELRRPSRTDAQVLRWLESVEDETLFLSAISLLELEIGALRLQRRDERAGKTIARWIDERVVAFFADRILPIDVAVAQRCAALHVPDPKPFRDALIAATALVHHFTLVTRNEPDFLSCGVKLLNPWRS